MRAALRRAAVAVAVMALSALGLHAQSGNPNPMDSIRKLPSYREAFDTVTLLSPGRIAKLAPAMRAKWDAYLQRSRALHSLDTAAMQRELRSVGRTAMIRAPYTHDFSVKPSMTPAWFATDSARRMAEIILSFQAPNGGWSKHVDFTKHVRAPGESYFAEDSTWTWISTIDNDATTEEIHFLARANAATRDARYEAAIGRGIDYLLASQYPNGCFPQIYPIQGSYHDAATFNDDATINVLRLFREVAAGDYAYVSAKQRRAARTAVSNGTSCILDAQVVVDGTPTAWGQQHDPLTLAPTSARSYELTSLTALESAGILEFLMSDPSPADRVVRAVYAGIDWLNAVPLHGLSYAGYQLKKQDGAAPLWGRLYEIGSNRPIMANRDGIKLYDWNKLTDRRAGYGWYTTRPAETLAIFARWSRSHPRPATLGSRR
jgi:PelA/Pel-15E family pectate lyase